MKEGDVVIVPMLQADGRIKNRPTILLREMPAFGDVLVCGLSTQLRQAAPTLDELIVPTDADFSSSGLITTSLIRLGFLATAPRNRIAGVIGSISAARHKRLLQKLSAFLSA